MSPGTSSGAAPFGSWPSPITPGSLAAGSVRVTTLVADGDDLWWSETRPSAKGRTALMHRASDGSLREVTPADANVRTRVHSYGGAAWWVDGGVCVYSDDADFRLRRLGPSDAEPLVLTPDGPDRSRMYADGRISADGKWFVCVRERITSPEHLNEIICVATDGSGREEIAVTGADFYSDPRPSPCGRRLAWLQWNHPNMPWDGCELHVGRLDGGAVTGSRLVAGGPDEWIFGPGWHDGGLSWVSDGSGWSTLWVLDGDPLYPETPPRRWADLTDGEIQTAPWIFGMSRHATWPAKAGGDRALAYAVAGRGGSELRLIDPQAAGSEAGQDPTAYRAHTSFSALRAWRGGVVGLAGSSSTENEVLHVTASSEGPQARVVYSPPALHLDTAYTPEPEPVTFPTSGGEVAHALYYRPAHPDHEAGDGGDAPPLLVMAHGGPTGAARTGLHLGLRFWTSRGIAVADVDYRGSTGYGRAYRRALDGGWGVTDVADCVAAAQHLAERGDADPDRLAIIGASAGGYVVLQALVDYDVFSAGIIRYGVTDLEALARDTHKFEKHYLDRLVGPYPAEREIYVERSPIHRVDRISCPMLVLQGDSDPVVPPEQAETLVEALGSNGLPYGYLLFEGEAHGFRGAEAIVAAAEAELSFLGQIFGFEPAGGIPPVPRSSVRSSGVVAGGRTHGRER
jgi:dipeptidyl aminopeptidase/acylaminoacyl peptidase